MDDFRKRFGNRVEGMRWRFDYLEEDFEVVLKQVCDNFWIQIWDLDEYEIWVT